MNEGNANPLSAYSAGERVSLSRPLSTLLEEGAYLTQQRIVVAEPGWGPCFQKLDRCTYCGEIRIKKPPLTLNLGTNALKVTSEPPQMAGRRAACKDMNGLRSTAYSTRAIEPRYKSKVPFTAGGIESLMYSKIQAFCCQSLLRYRSCRIPCRRRMRSDN
ncbi:hypothetical protein J6590_054457 [Homalodisca vitripennis]|nr:hypothetical protein J6590_054457 [Homalodisca vitripennis]